MPGDIIILHICTKNYDQMMIKLWFLRYGAQQMDGQTNGQMDGWRWVPYLKKLRKSYFKSKLYLATSG